MKLIKYRGENELFPVYYWTDEQDKCFSPQFESEEAAMGWAKRIYDRPLCSFVTECNWSHLIH